MVWVMLSPAKFLCPKGHYISSEQMRDGRCPFCTTRERAREAATNASLPKRPSDYEARRTARLLSGMHAATIAKAESDATGVQRPEPSHPDAEIPRAAQASEDYARSRRKRPHRRTRPAADCGPDPDALDLHPGHVGRDELGRFAGADGPAERVYDWNIINRSAV